MRVLYVSASNSGHDRRFISAWAAAGWDISALVLDGPSSSSLSLHDQINDFSPDVIQAGPLTDIAWKVAHCWDGPLIATSWGFDLMDQINKDDLALKRASEVIARADQLLVDNDAPRRRALELGADPSRIVQFPWGVDLDRFTPRAIGMPSTGTEEEPRIILCTRRHEEIYGVEMVLQAFLAAATQHSNIRLHLAGTGSLTTRLLELTLDSPHAHKVSFLGELAPSELAECYRSSDLYVSASSIDGTSVSLLEAMASGAPVLVSDIDGNSEWVNSDTGFSFPLNDEHTIGAFFEKFASGETQLHTELRRRSVNALTLVRTKADWRINAKRLPEIAAIAIAQKGTP